MMMKRHIAYILSLVLLISCVEEEKLSPIPRPVDMDMRTSAEYLVMGDTLTVSFEVTEEGQCSNEDFVIRLSVSEDGQDASDLFAGFVSEVVFAEGDTLAEVSVPVASSGVTGTHILSLDAFSRGYRISGTPKEIRVADYHKVSLSVRNSSESLAVEGETFVLVASLAVAAKEDVIVGLSVEDGADALEGLPESMTIRAGTMSVESSPITVLPDGGEYDPRTFVFRLTSSSAMHPMSSETLAVGKVDVDKPLGSLVSDERHLYPHPETAYMSSGRVSAVMEWGGQAAVEVVAGQTPHPTLPGWTFHNAVEFHYIQEMLYNNNILGQPNAAGGQDRPHSFADQNTWQAERYMNVDNDRYTAITSGGYMRMWAAKDPSMAKGYGTAALYCNKFKNPAGPNGNGYKPAYCHILPGMRIEFRMRVGGELNGFNPAIWLTGNSNIQPSGSVPWPTCGEIDVVEVPVGEVTGKSPWQTFHFGNAAGDGTDVCKLTSNALSDVDPVEWNIYWMEWTDDSTVSVGVNGRTNVTVTRAEVEEAGAVWPFDMVQNPYGLNLILTMGYPAPAPWVLGFSAEPPEGWDSGFASLSYPESRTSPLAPRMELDWIRYYVSQAYPAQTPTTCNSFKYY